MKLKKEKMRRKRKKRWKIGQKRPKQSDWSQWLLRSQRRRQLKKRRKRWRRLHLWKDGRLLHRLRGVGHASCQADLEGRSTSCEEFRQKANWTSRWKSCEISTSPCSFGLWYKSPIHICSFHPVLCLYIFHIFTSTGLCYTAEFRQWWCKEIETFCFRVFSPLVLCFRSWWLNL